MADYARMSIPELDELYITDYWLLLHDAVVYHYSQTEEGRDYLERCWILEQTEPDVGALREKFGQ